MAKAAMVRIRGAASDTLRTGYADKGRGRRGLARSSPGITFPSNRHMNKKSLSERDICTKFIAPAIQQAGWQLDQFRLLKKRDVFGRYGEQARAVLEALLDKFADHGVQDIEDARALELPPFDQFGTKTQIRRGIFGGVEQYEQAVRALEQALYDAPEQRLTQPKA